MSLIQTLSVNVVLFTEPIIDKNGSFQCRYSWFWNEGMDSSPSENVGLGGDNTDPFHPCQIKLCLLCSGYVG